jgi:WD40 repeat protein
MRRWCRRIDDHTVATGSADGMARVWNVKQTKHLQQFQHGEGQQVCVMMAHVLVSSDVWCLVSGLRRSTPASSARSADSS